MAPLPQNNTARLFFDYVTGNLVTSQNHTFQVRTPGTDTATLAAAQASVLAFLQAIGPAGFRAGWHVEQVRLQTAGSNFSTPIELAEGLKTFVGTNGDAFNINREATEIVFVGRSPTSGRRVEVSVYGITHALTPTFRVPATFEPNNWVANALAVLNSEFPEGDAWRTIDGSEALWYGYANWNNNSFWETELRS